MKKLFTIFLTVMLPIFTLAAKSDAYGRWITEKSETDNRVIVDIYEKNGKVYGKVHQLTNRYDSTGALRKDVKLGNLDTTLKVGYEGKIERATVDAPAVATNTYTNTFYFQPSFKVVGVSVEPKVLYAMYDTNSSDIKLSADQKHKVWGVDLNLSYGNTLAEGKYGKLEYSVSLNNKYRRLASTLTGADAVINNDSTKNSKYEVSFNPSVTYTTPDFVGFTGSVKVSDELSKVIGSNTYSNGVKVELNANYKKEVETAVGKVVIKPYVSYNLINRDTVNNSNGGKELKTGLKVSLEK